MSRLSLRTRVVIWSAIIPMATVFAALFAIHSSLQMKWLKSLKFEMQEEAENLSVEIWRGSKGNEKLPPISQARITPQWHGRPVEIRDAAGHLLYRGPHASSRELGITPLGFYQKMLGATPFLIGTFPSKSAFICFATPLADYYRVLRQLRFAFFIALPAVALLCILGGIFVARQALEPMQKIAKAVTWITAENLHRRLPVPKTKDEIHTLTEVLNETFARLEASYSQATRFASDASHQLKTPISVLRAGIEELMRDRTIGPAQIEELAELLQQTRRLTSLSEGLLLLARADAGSLALQIKETDLIPILKSCAEDGVVLAEASEVSIETDFPASFRVMADPARTEQVLLNLIENAVKYNRRKGIVRIAVGTDENGPNIIVANTGSPIPGEKMPVIFNRFMRGDKEELRAGHGLGLSIARELARAQRGDLTLLRSDYEITEFQLRFRAPSGTSGGIRV